MCIAAPSAVAQDAVYNDIDRNNWTVTTSTATNYGYVPDGSTGMPEDMFDGSGATFLSLVKPNKSYSPVPAQAADFIPSFTVDMQTSQAFNFIRWQHRSGNIYNYLRVWGVDVYGSNDGSNFTLLVSELEIPTNDRTSHIQDNEPYLIDLPTTFSYRYVKVELTKWSDNSGGAASGSTMQIGEFGLGTISVDKVIYKPADVNFGDIMQGYASTKTLTVSAANLDAALTYVLGGDDASAFSVTPGGYTSTGGTATLTFSPTAKKLYNATLTVNSTGALETQTINLTGNADFDLPVVLSSANNSNEHYYYIQFARQAVNAKVLTVVDAAYEGDTIRQLPLDATNPNQLWKIVGTWDNYYLVNKTNEKSLVHAYTPVGENAEGEPVPEVNKYITETGEYGDTFGFVRYSTTDTWQLKNTLNVVQAPENKLYLNDLSGEYVTGYSVNNAGNQLIFIDAETAKFIVSGDTVKLGSTGINTTKELTIPVGGVKLTAGITVAISDDADNVFTLNTTSLPATGGNVEVTYAPTAYKKVSYATVTLASGAVQQSFVITATSDNGSSKYYVGTAEQWGTRNDGERAATIPTALKAGDILWIAEGEYTIPSINIPANVQIYGGFAGTETSPSSRAVGAKPWEFTHPSVVHNSGGQVFTNGGANTLVDGLTLDGRGGAAGTGVNGRAFQYLTGNAGHIIRNSIIKNFNSTGAGTNAGDGGAFNVRTVTGVEIYNNLITENIAGTKGGAGYFDGGCVIHDCEITNNSAPLDGVKPIGNANGGGGGLFLAPSANVSAYNCYIAGNVASYGGGVFIRAGARLYNSIIVNNEAYSGSGIAFDERDSNATVYNVTVADNFAKTPEGVGVVFSADGTDRVQKLYNSILWNNNDGYEVYNIGVAESASGKATPEIKNVIIDDLTFYAAANPALAITDGIAEESRNALFETGSYVTAATSPGINGGAIHELTAETVNEANEPVPATYITFTTGKDFAGGQRIVSTIDIGPYEDQTGASIDKVTPEIDGNVIATKYYTIQGIEVSTPTATGVYIQKDLLDTGKVRVTKFLHIAK
ncbi:hypothetical protein FACS1894176_00120 [Bacteroidia bacterium]|nr:hypothetical protein FACS1894176_00120 [Bacteroidia bacterium]